MDILTRIQSTIHYLNVTNVVFLLCSFFIVYKLFLIIKYGFRVNVNCWFCNAWMKVPYSKRNSFVCSSCQQYNGFNKDGDYNKIIPDQHDTSDLTISNSYNTNGLCKDCNQNQQRKVSQLANFIPIDEDNYDVEIEHFQKQLEQSYKLCKSCRRKVKNVIAKQNLNLLCNPSLGKRRYDLFFLRQKEIIIKQVKQMFLLNTVKFILVATTAILLLKIIKIPKEFYEYLPTDIFNNDRNITIISLALQVILLFFDLHTTNIMKMNRFISWIVLIIPLFWSYNKKYVIYINWIQIVACIFQIVSLIPSNKLTNQRSILKNCQFKKISQGNEEWSDEEEDFDNVSLYPSIFTANNTNKLFTPNTANNLLENLPSVYDKPLNPPLNVDLNNHLNDLHLSDKWKSGFSLNPSPITVNHSAVRPNRQLLTPPVLNIKNKCDSPISNSFSLDNNRTVISNSSKQGYESHPNLFLLNTAENSAFLFKRQISQPYHASVQFSGYFSNPNMSNIKFNRVLYTQNQFLPHNDGISSRLVLKNGAMNVFNDTNLSRRTM